MSSQRLWVYGTLRPGCSNQYADHLRQASCHTGIARVQGRLYRIDWYPGIRLGGGLGGGMDDWVVGDLFEILDPGVLSVLDQYEGSNEYHRVAAEAVLESGERVQAWVYEYIGAVSESQRIASGDWLAEAT